MSLLKLVISPDHPDIDKYQLRVRYADNFLNGVNYWSNYTRPCTIAGHWTLLTLTEDMSEYNIIVDRCWV
jgi:hypothetical protein